MNSTDILPARTEAHSFYGQSIDTIHLDGNDYLLLGQLCDNLGIDTRGQQQNLERQVWAEGMTCVTHVMLPGADRAYPRYLINTRIVGMWLATITTSRIRDEESRLMVERYQRELADKIHEWISGGAVRRELSEAEVVLQALTILKTKTEQQAQEIEVLAPKASAWDALVSSAGSWSYQDAAHALYEQKHIVIGQKRLVAILVDWSWMYRDHKGRPHAYQRILEQSLLTEKIRTYVDTVTGETLQSSAPQVRITGKGLDVIYRRLSAATEAVAS
ncbi:phage antirepressor KilAC domain-containing protein [Leifsonia sp. F6_8S_P_1B]|uniref:Phage antirepressor KilAC domain-containing protein n=1 Tax=Leifsonia williamsii TaxID=3035919 RepID=A0ABT8KG56_9MICO|nr:phage antirepressor KilAC domain-containing protein [Leifsonia williamsii]MDN4616449.1 phage antirepressor KilAC domain-containing protein [Leifsonia williamsii]